VGQKASTRPPRNRPHRDSPCAVDTTRPLWAWSDSVDGSV